MLEELQETDSHLMWFPTGCFHLSVYGIYVATMPQPCRAADLAVVHSNLCMGEFKCSVTQRGFDLGDRVEAYSQLFLGGLTPEVVK